MLILIDFPFLPQVPQGTGIPIPRHPNRKMSCLSRLALLALLLGEAAALRVPATVGKTKCDGCSGRCAKGAAMAFDEITAAETPSTWPRERVGDVTRPPRRARRALLWINRSACPCGPSRLLTFRLQTRPASARYSRRRPLGTYLAPGTARSSGLFYRPTSLPTPALDRPRPRSTTSSSPRR